MNIAPLRSVVALLGLLTSAASPLAKEPLPENAAGTTPAAAEGKPLIVTQETAGTFYRDYKRLTAQPRLIAPLTAILCRTPSKEELDKEKAMTGPHAHVWVHIYANPSAADAIAKKAGEFPVGAVIVKEKLGTNLVVSDVGGMIKRAPGYDTANGDWEFFFHTPGGEFQSGKMANCIECHNGGPRDHVFSVWKLSSR